MKNLISFTIALLFFTVGSFGQAAYTSFIDLQRSFPRPGNAILRKQDILKKQFEERGFAWPAKYIYIRSFKYDGELEVWIKNERKEPYKLFNTYKVCALAGTLGPKRMQGDFQVPEGFYYINEFNPNSNYYLSLGINYPNPSDRLLSDPLRPGGDIYIHGNCVTVGCIPVNDQQIEDLYILAAHAKNQGQDFIPVHIFPIRYSKPKSETYLKEMVRNNPPLGKFSENLEKVFDHFEATKQLPVIMTDSHGDYVFDGLVKKVVKVEKPVEKPKRVPVQHRYRDVQLVDVVHQGARFPGGGEGFQKYINQLGNILAPELPNGKKKASVVVEFVIDRDGVPTNFRMVQGVNEDFDDELITVMEQMPNWQPAILDEKPVAKMIRQTIWIE
ncbi:MAG: energy transducer TonB [Flavisolibacter sp.]